MSYSKREFMLPIFCSDYSVIAHLEEVSSTPSLNVVNLHVVTPLTCDALAVSYATVLLKNPAMFLPVLTTTHISYQIEVKKPMINRYADR